MFLKIFTINDIVLTLRNKYQTSGHGLWGSTPGPSPGGTLASACSQHSHLGLLGTVPGS